MLLTATQSGCKAFHPATETSDLKNTLTITQDVKPLPNTRNCSEQQHRAKTLGWVWDTGILIYPIVTAMGGKNWDIEPGHKPRSCALGWCGAQCKLKQLLDHSGLYSIRYQQHLVLKPHSLMQKPASHHSPAASAHSLPLCGIQSFGCSGYSELENCISTWLHRNYANPDLCRISLPVPRHKDFLAAHLQALWHSVSAYLNRSIRAWRKVRKLLCRLMEVSSFSAMFPNTCHRKQKGFRANAACCRITWESWA